MKSLPYITFPVLLVLLGGLALSSAHAAPAPETCPTVEPNEALQPVVGLWSLTQHDGEEPETAYRLRVYPEGSAQVWLGDDESPVYATVGINCCGHLVLKPDQEGTLAPMVAEFEVAEDTLTLFARDGDWVFTRQQLTEAE